MTTGTPFDPYPAKTAGTTLQTFTLTAPAPDLYQNRAQRRAAAVPWGSSLALETLPQRPNADPGPPARHAARDSRPRLPARASVLLEGSGEERSTDRSTILAARVPPARPAPVLEDGSRPAPPRWERRPCWKSLRSDQIGRRLAPLCCPATPGGEPLPGRYSRESKTPRGSAPST